jgi:hypothetical protein
LALPSSSLYLQSTNHLPYHFLSHRQKFTLYFLPPIRFLHAFPHSSLFNPITSSQLPKIFSSLFNPHSLSSCFHPFFTLPITSSLPHHTPFLNLITSSLPHHTPFLNPITSSLPHHTPFLNPITSSLRHHTPFLFILLTYSHTLFTFNIRRSILFSN